MKQQLKRVYWQMGQSLLPQHLISQEESLLDTLALRFEQGGLPSYGLGQLKWNASLLRQGVLSIESLTLVLPSGILLDIPGNASVAPLDLNATGLTQATVYLHLLSSKDQEEVRIDSSEEEASIALAVNKVSLSVEQSTLTASETFKLALLCKNPDTSWTLNHDFIPPLLRVGTSPFLQPSLQKLSAQLASFQKKLEQDLTADQLVGKHLVESKQSLLAVLRLRSFLSNIEQEVQPHPYQLYQALVDTWQQLSIYYSSQSVALFPAYQHEALGTQIQELFSALERTLSVERKATPYLPFTCQDRVYSLETFPENLKQAREVYLLIQKPQLSSIIHYAGLKVTARSRMTLVHQLALPGIPLHPVERLPFAHTFGNEVDIFQLGLGEEWDHALAEESLAFYQLEAMEQCKNYLYWR